VDDAAAAAAAAGVLHDPARALAGRAGALDGEEALLAADAAGGAAARAGRRLRAALAAGAEQASQATVVGTRICAFLPAKASSSVIERL
jgi:hypothetical protein